jgi:hypothetical protein
MNANDILRSFNAQTSRKIRHKGVYIKQPNEHQATSLIHIWPLR